MLKNFEFQCGVSLPKVQIIYQTYGNLNRDRSNAILYPVSHSTKYSDIDWLIRPDGILDSNR